MSEGIKFLRDEHHDTIVKSFSENGLTKDDNPTWLKKILDGDLSVNADEVESHDSELDRGEDSEGYSDEGEGAFNTLVKDREARRIWVREVRGRFLPSCLKIQGQIQVFVGLTECKIEE